MDWLTGFLDKKQLVQAPKAEELSPTNRPKYFGNTKLKDGKMIKFLRDDLKQLKEDVEGGEKAFHRLIEALAAESHREPGTKPAKEQIQLFEDFTCTSSGCHGFYGTGKVGSAPIDRLRIAAVAYGDHQRSDPRALLRRKERPHALLCQVGRQAQGEHSERSASRNAGRVAPRDLVRAERGRVTGHGWLEQLAT